MQAFKKTLVSALLFLGSFSSSFTHADTSLALQPFEFRLQKIIKTPSEKERLQFLFDLYWDWRMAENPDEASFLGYPGKYDQWPDFSQEAFKNRSRFAAQLLSALSTVPSNDLGETDAISLGILKRTLEEEVAGFQFGNRYLLVNQMFGIHLNIPNVISLMPAKTIEDYENILSRLNKLPGYFQQIIDLLEEGLAAGITPARIALLAVPQQILNQMVDQPLDSSMLHAFKQFPSDFNPETCAHLLNEAELAFQTSVIPALQQLYAYFTERYLPNCRKSTAFSDLPNGRSWYDFMVRSSTTTTLSSQEIHAIGLGEVKRIHEEMLALIQSTGHEGTFEDFLHFLKTDPQFFYESKEELLQGYQTLTRHIEAKLPRLFGKLPSLPFEVLPVPAYSEESQGAAYYCQGSQRDNRPGIFFINTSFPSQRAKWEMEPLALHEAVPGHHLQITLAQELQDLPSFRKNAFFTAYIEGWGLYAESLGTELGLYQDPYSTFGRLTYEMMRAIRLVVDTGMHAMGWSRQEAIDFFKQYISLSDHEITTEVDRYLVMPGQALAYKIGELKIKEMRQWAAQQLGDKFDVRAFHHEWLQHGTVPLDIAEQQIVHWVEKENTKR